MKHRLLTTTLALFATAHAASAAVAEWDFDGLSVAPTKNVTIATPVENNTFGAGVTISDFTLNASDRGNAFQRDRAEQAVWDNGPPTMAFTVTIDDTVTVDLTQLDFTYGFQDSTPAGNKLTPEYSLAFSQGSGTNASGSLPTRAAGDDAYEESTIVSSDLSGLTGLTNTSVTFTWTLTSAIDEGRNFDLQGPSDPSRAHFMDDVTLHGVPEPSATGLIISAGVALLLFRRRVRS